MKALQLRVRRRTAAIHHLSGGSIHGRHPSGLGLSNAVQFASWDWNESAADTLVLPVANRRVCCGTAKNQAGLRRLFLAGFASWRGGRSLLSVGREGSRDMQPRVKGPAIDSGTPLEVLWRDGERVI